MNKTLLIDIEVASNLGFVWGKYKQDVTRFKEHWYLLSYSYKWLGEKTVHVAALNDFPRFKKDHKDDLYLAKGLHALFNEAEVIIAQNGDAFDVKKVNARLLYHGLTPPSHYNTVDTLKVLRRTFGFSSNKLDDICDQLGIGRKHVHTGFDLWERCMNGERKAFEEMKVYNKKDIVLLEKLYLKVRPWMNSHPNMSFSVRGTAYNPACPKCGKFALVKRGFRINRSVKRQSYVCLMCHGWSTGETLETRMVR